MNSSTNFDVNLYAYAKAKVMADSHLNAAIRVINTEMTIDNLRASRYEISWSGNDAMMVDVNVVGDDEDTEEFYYENLIDESANVIAGSVEKPFEVCFYFNITLLVNDAANEEEAIHLAGSTLVFGDLVMGAPVISVDFDISGCVSPTIDVFASV